MVLRTGTDFQPDIIVETTSVCDRKCPGCYAPNLLSKAPVEQLARTNPELFLSPPAFEKSLGDLRALHTKERRLMISFRGGEPTKNPWLPGLLELAAASDPAWLYLETHGRWLLGPSDASDKLRAALKRVRCTVKISFDRMHGLGVAELARITTSLDADKIPWLIAITEENPEEFEKTRRLCPWVPSSKLIFQKKAFSAHELVRPRLGVIRVSGAVKRVLDVKSGLNAAAEAPARGATA